MDLTALSPRAGLFLFLSLMPCLSLTHSRERVREISFCYHVVFPGPSFPPLTDSAWCKQTWQVPALSLSLSPFF